MVYNMDRIWIGNGQRNAEYHSLCLNQWVGEIYNGIGANDHSLKAIGKTAQKRYN